MPAYKNQHFVPQVMLRQFAVDDNKKAVKIWLHAHQKVVKNASIADQCSKSFFYGKDLKFEKAFHQPEHFFAEVAHNLSVSGDISEKHINEFLKFWIIQHLRTNVAISHNALVMSELRRVVMLGGEDDEAFQKWVGPPMSQEQVIEIVLGNFSTAYNVLRGLHCLILRSHSDMPFVTSDNPAIQTNLLIQKRYKTFRNWGLGSAGLYLYMPISPFFAFFAFDDQVYHMPNREGHFCSLSAQDVVSLNQFIFIHSDSVLFIPPLTDSAKTIKTMQAVNDFRPSERMRVNLAVSSDIGNDTTSSRFVVASEEEFTQNGGLIHLESIKPRLPSHLKALKFRNSPKYIDTKSRAGLKRWRVD